MAKRFIQYFEDAIKDNWDLPAMTNYVTKQTYAYKDVAREIAKLHILFRELNIQQDDKIALVGNNTPEWAITFLATITYGAVIVPILQDFHPDDIAHIIEHSESKLLFVGDTYWDRLEEKDTSTLRAVFSLSDFRCMRQAQGETLHLIMRQLPTLFKERYSQGVQRDEVRYAQKDDQEMCVLNYTSGTTGFSKGVMLKGDNICCMIDFINKYNIGAKGARFLSFLPLAHAYGCLTDLFMTFVTGTHATFFSQPIAVNTLLKAFEEVKPHWISTVPLVVETIYKKIFLPRLRLPKYRIMLKLPFFSRMVYKKIGKTIYSAFGGCFKQMYIGGAALNPEVESFLLKINIPFTVGYGITECSPLVSVDFKEFTPQSVGPQVDGVSIKINSNVPQKEAGEIWVKGRNVMMGYYKDNEATQKVFTHDGWFKTGDMGVLDSKGNLYIKGRCKTMILTSSGQNVYPEEIEAKLNNSPFIEESLVVQRGEKIIALVVPDKTIENAKNPNTVIEEVIKLINKQMPLYASINGFEIQSKEFEKTPKKSIKRYIYE